MNWIDTHCHLNGYQEDGSLTQVLASATAAGVVHLIAIGTSPDDWAIHQELADRFPEQISFTVGVHPCHVHVGEDSSLDWNAVEQLADAFQGERVSPVAFGEMGLDYARLPQESALARALVKHQQAVFRAQLEIARNWDVPLVIHSREAFEDTVSLIDASGIDWLRIVFHCFTYGPEKMQILRARGGRASFTGILTYPNAESVRRAALEQGLEALLLETDAPFLSPQVVRKERNQPAYVSYVGAYAAQLWQVPVARIAEITTQNARDFFRVNPNALSS